MKKYEAPKKTTHFHCHRACWQLPQRFHEALGSIACAALPRLQQMMDCLQDKFAQMEEDSDYGVGIGAEVPAQAAQVTIAIADMPYTKINK